MMTSTTLGAEKVQTFAENLRGALLEPGDPGYDEARKVWNGMIDRRPALIARCAGAADVLASVRFAQENGLEVAVRGGGHSFPGLSVGDGGLMIDLSPMKGISVDPARRTALAEAGVLWGEIDHETQAFGLAVTGGQITHTGIAGLTLGGGLGWLMRKHGLTCDNLISVQIVTADGQFLKASAEENAELFWGVRGGGGNFGIVTSFEYQLHPVGPMVFGGLVTYPLAEAHQVLTGYRESVKDSPEELVTVAAFLTLPDGDPSVGIFISHVGDLADAEKDTRPLRTLGTVTMDQVGPLPYTALQTIFDAGNAPGQRYYMKSSFLNDLPDALIATAADEYSRVPSAGSVTIFVQMGGAVSQVERDATAFYHRDVTFSTTTFSVWNDPQEDEANIGWARGMSDALSPHFSGGVYVNELGVDHEERIRSAYESSYERLVALKNKYDPTNFFHLNPNISPTG